MLTLEACRQRLNAFCAALREERIDLAVLANYRHAYYFSGHLRETDLPQILLASAEGKTILITDVSPPECAADELMIYESYSIDWPVSFAEVCARAVRLLRVSCGKFRSGILRIAIEKERTCGIVLETVRVCWPA